MSFLIAVVLGGCPLAFSYRAFPQGLSAGADNLLTLEELSGSERDYVLVNFDTEKGSFTIRVYPEIAPLSSENFLRLVEEGFYDGIAVHRVVRDFVMQAGEVPSGGEKEKLIKEFADEVNHVRHAPGTVAFAKLYDTDKKEYVANSASAQFFINLGDNDRLNENFTVFGYVNWGMETVNKIEVGDRIIRAFIVSFL